MRLVWGRVLAVRRPGPDAMVLAVLGDDGREGEAICYPALTGECAEDDRVLLNTTAVDLALGTGGRHFVVARVAPSLGPAGVAFDQPSGGHIMKLRYTPMQRDVLSVEEPDSPHHDAMRDADSLHGMPVVCCSLHSHVPLVAAAIKERRAQTRVAYVMTDGASLPLALSDLVRACRDAGLLDTTITAGQAFGGELEAVTLHSALLAARHAADADVAIVSIGPGVVGTASAFGHGGVAQGEAINAAGCLGGRPVASLRVSFADPRERHRGVSHHSLTALARVALAPASIAVPALPAEEAALVDAALEAAGVWARHTRVDADGALPDSRGVALRSMGRTPPDDPAFFAAAAAAGRVAADLLSA